MHRAVASVALGVAATAIAIAVVSCSSTDTSAGGVSMGFAGGGGGITGLGPSCVTSASCLPGQVCCSISGGGGLATCQKGPCPAQMDQLCGISAECLRPGDVCLSSGAAAGPMICGPAGMEGGSLGPEGLGDASDGEASSDGTGDDGQPQSDAPVSEGPPPADATSQSDAANDGDAGSPDVVEAGTSDG